MVQPSQKMIHNSSLSLKPFQPHNIAIRFNYQQVIMQQQTNGTPIEQQFKKIGNYVYSLDWKLGEGSFATVYKAIHEQTKQIYALKVIKFASLTSKLSMVLLQQQISIIQALDHQNVIKCYQIVKSSNNCYIVMDYCKFGDMQSLLKMKKKFGQDQIASFVYQMYKGFRYLSDNKIIHRDFKPGNLFVDENGCCRIADFGFAIRQTEQKFTDVSLGSPFYMAPQIIYFKQYSSKTDIWSFGVTIFELVMGHPPLYGVKSQQELKQRVLLPINYEQLPLSADLISFLQKCICIKASERISFEQMENQPFLQKVIQDHQSSKLYSSSSISDTQSCTKSSRVLYKTMMRKPISYDEAASLLQYCRFLQKICQSIRPRSEILQKWLLIMMRDLYKAKIRQNQVTNYEKFKEIISQYYQKYLKEYSYASRKVRIEDVLQQCKRQMGINKKLKPVIMMLGNQTQILSQALSHPLRLVYYTRLSNISQYLNKMCLGGLG